MIKVYNEFFGHDRQVVTVPKLSSEALSNVLPYRDLSEVCTVGFEPNPTHTPVLKTLEDAYRTCGWRVHFMTRYVTGGGREERRCRSAPFQT